MNKNEKLAFELQNIFNQLRRSKLIKHDHANLRGAERHIMVLISNLKAGGPINVSEIAEKIGVTLAAVTHQINTLEKKGYIKRLSDNTDRRIVLVQITKKNTNKVVKLKEEFSKKIQILIKHLGEKDTKDLIRIIKKIADFQGSDLPHA